jgi:hypothetical protein
MSNRSIFLPSFDLRSFGQNNQQILNLIAQLRRSVKSCVSKQLILNHLIWGVLVRFGTQPAVWYAGHCASRAGAGGSTILRETIGEIYSKRHEAELTDGLVVFSVCPILAPATRSGTHRTDGGSDQNHIPPKGLPSSQETTWDCRKVAACE